MRSVHKNGERAIKILVVGDSMLSSFGGCFRNVFGYFREIRGFERPLQFVNASVAGMTAADAWQYVREVTRGTRFGALVLAVGNCDPCAHGYLKPRTPLPGLGGGLFARWKTRRHRKRHPRAYSTIIDGRSAGRENCHCTQ